MANTPAETNREQDLSWRAEIRAQDVAWRQHLREEDMEWRKRESRLNTRRSALNAAACAALPGSPPEVVFDLAAQFEDWMKRPAKKPSI